MTSALETGRPPQQIRPDLWLFPPNRDCRGGSSWWLDVNPEPVLIDCPPLTEATLTALQVLAAERRARILLTSREGHGRLRRLQERVEWPVLVQEQEAYLLPGVQNLETFAEETTTASGLRLLWTPGPTPGHAVVHAPTPSDVLFCGRLLVPVASDRLAPTAASTHLSLAAAAGQSGTSPPMASSRSQSSTGFWGRAGGVARRPFGAVQQLGKGRSVKAGLCLSRS